MGDMVRGIMYGLGLSQFAIVIGVLIYSPKVDLHVYSTRASVVNGTVAVTTLNDNIIHIEAWILGTSILAAVFSTMTYNVAKAGLGENDYQYPIPEEASVWEFVFWVYVFAVHTCLIVMLTNPVSFHAALLAAVVVIYFLVRACAPRMGQSTMTYENTNVVGLAMGYLLIYSQIGKPSSNLLFVLFFLLVSDYTLGIGHVWESSPSMDTVFNCRLSYTVSSILGLACMYAMWGVANE